MTLREQIKEFHREAFGAEFHAHRRELIPQMVQDLILKIFDDMEYTDLDGLCWVVPADQRMRAIKKARSLIETLSLRENVPAVE